MTIKIPANMSAGSSKSGKPKPKVSRRGFVVGSAAATGGLALGFHLPFGIGAADAQSAAGTEVNAWVVVQPDNTCVIRVARSEMGQGTITGLVQLVGEELDCDWKKVKAERVTPGQNLARKRVWGEMGTGGSRGIRTSQDYVRRGGAAARMMLMQAAADQWKVPVGELTVANGVITHAASKRTATYGSVAAAAAKLTPPDPKSITLRDPKEWKIAGKPLKRLDTADKLDGSKVYGIDIKLPGLLCAAIKDCPVYGGKVKSYDEAKILSRPGVRKVVKVKDTAVAVVADTWWRAKSALDALPIEWDEGAGSAQSDATIAAHLKEGLTSANHNGGRQNGDALKAIRPDLGGGFGRRGATQDYVHQAVAIAKQLPGTPVKLIWSREEDMAHDFYRPISQCKLSAGLDQDGKLVGLHVRLSGQSINALANPSLPVGGPDERQIQGWYEKPGDAQLGYSVPNLAIEYAMRNTHVPVGPWRGVNTNQNGVYMECFMDEVARAAGKDPLAFRRGLMEKFPKHLAVLNAAAAKADYDKPLPAGVHRGIAQFMGYGSYSAAVAEVSVSPQGKLKVHRLVLALNCGHAVNPDQIAAQVEGSVAYGLTATLYGECPVKSGRMTDLNFDSYQILRLAEMPKVETVIVPTYDFWGGVGEPTICVTAPAVLNAIHAATGRPVRSLPLKNVKLV